MLLLRRYYDDRTEGKLIFPDGSHCFVLERPWLNNKPNVSCIPEGSYLVDRDYHGKFQWYKIREGQIKGRSSIEIHAGNKVEHSLGCLLPCMELENGVGKRSKEALDKLKEFMRDKSFILEIRKWHPKDGKWKE